MKVLDKDMLEELKAKALELGLHSLHGDPWMPVSVEPLLDEVTSYYYTWMRPNFKAWLLRYRENGEYHVDMALNEKLRELAHSADRREAVTHEWTHESLKHRGSTFIYLWREPKKVSFDRYVDNLQERQCLYVSAFLLIQTQVLMEGRGWSDSDIARRIDVPKHLFPYRWYIWRKYRM